MDNRPIGVFDSGVGGLTVVKEIINQLPNENIIYFGDTARVPYGTKSPETVTKYSFQNVRFLLTHDVKTIVIACNTASAVSLNSVKKEFELPILGVVRPGAEAASKVTKNEKVGIIGTRATVLSKAYEKAIKALDNDILVTQAACPLFVSLVEEGWLENEVTYKTAEEYLKIMKNKEIDTLILGCTHFPLLMKTIRKVMGKGVNLVNPALETAKQLKDILKSKDMLRDEALEPEYKYFLSDIETKFEKIANNCLEKKIRDIEKVDIEQY